MKDRLYVQCDCQAPEHLLQFDRDEDYVYVYVLLTTDGFFSRAWKALKYVFGYKSRYGHFDEILLNKQTQKELVDYLSK